MLESRAARAFDREVAQKHAHGGKDHPRRATPVVPAPLLDEVPATAGRIRPRVVPKVADQVPDITSVRGQGSLDHAPVDLHPLEELPDTSNWLGPGLAPPDDSSLTEMLEEAAGTREDPRGAVS